VTKTINFAETFDENVKMNIHWMVVFLNAGRFCSDLKCRENNRDNVCEYESMWGHLLDLVNIRDDWDDNKKLNFLRVCEESVINQANEFREDRIKKGYFGLAAEIVEE
jgi:hypothetical protein